MLGEEAQLIAAARAGDLAAYGRLVDRHQSAVRAFLRRLTGNPADADDLAQEAFARTWDVLGRFDGRSSLRTFICGVAFQYWRRARRAEARRERRDGAFHDVTQLQSEISPDLDRRLALRRAMDNLALDQRAAIALCVAGEFTHAEAAEALGLPLGTVKSHIVRGLAKLRAALGVVVEGAP